jgi:hypothetical protein
MPCPDEVLKAPRAGQKAKSVEPKAKAPVKAAIRPPSWTCYAGRAGATLAEVMKATRWQARSVRGFISGTTGKKMDLPVGSVKNEAGNVSTAWRVRLELAIHHARAAGPQLGEFFFSSRLPATRDSSLVFITPRCEGVQSRAASAADCVERLRI